MSKYKIVTNGETYRIITWKKRWFGFMEGWEFVKTTPMVDITVPWSSRSLKIALEKVEKLKKADSRVPNQWIDVEANEEVKIPFWERF